ncbi:mas-related G-protein coupled receptor member H-like isoform X1 [Catharus ustulatus]|uniref:mas-related G-protein coupled receptor member H-like isoform X1 n=1 Tax=Catharus ustulatus TaxID=91951 RepID=UPI0014077CCB|nr:mas-related G-protein coupled receptor member H-like isoform X1 [Catharus ustulatus]XP_032918615.1 mas-related G-protein coupled receptor member H-like isoform X1 [Catharus ustulatus]XP_032918616.1 mas-related G-protein coupled receptor member H-like isoform X1 [Catharus ustulatus]
MEVTTVCPSPASPTEGDDLCEINVSNVAIHSVTLLISLCGLAGNGAVLWFYSLDVGNHDILHLALADFLILLFTVPSALLFLVEDLSCSIIMPLMYLNFLYQLSQLSCFWGLFRLMLSSYVVNIFDLCERYFMSSIFNRLWWLVDGVQYWAFFALFTLMPTLTSLCPSDEQGHCRAALISMYAVILLLFVAPMVVSRAIDIIKAKRGSRKQQLETRDIVVFIIVLFTLLLVLFNFLQQLDYILVPTQVVSLLNCIYSSIKPFIYFVAGRCWSPWSREFLWVSRPSIFRRRKQTLLTVMMPPGIRRSEPVDPFHCSAKGPWHVFP